MVSVGDQSTRSLGVDYPVSARYLATAAIGNSSIDELADTVGEGEVRQDWRTLELLC